ncbi:MAG: hypothetical protein ACR2IP_10350 [Solirubrobacteraceae bacterium]
MRSSAEGASRAQDFLVWAVFAAGAALRTVFLVDYRPGFLGIPDTGSYIDAAHRGLFSNVYDPAGYPLFIRGVHALDPHLSLLILLQHCLGLATAALLYLVVRRVTQSKLLGLIPAVIVLFDGFGLWVEHTPISEPVFTFLVAGALYAALAAVNGPRSRLVLAGALIAAGGMVRPAGLILIPLFGAWIFGTRGGARGSRLLDAFTLIAPACLLVGAYVVVQNAQTGFTGITRDSGRVFYARAAPFADCSRFTPPAGTATLCEKTPPGSRGSPNQYLTGFPDHQAQIGPAGRSISPAWRAFGPPPNGDGPLAAFGRAAIGGQPLDYLQAVAKDFHYYWADHHRAFIAAAARVDPAVEHAVTSYYATGAGVANQGLGFLRWYGRSIEVTGALMIALLIAPVSGLLVRDRRARGAAVLLACTGWLLPLASDALATVDPRYLLPAYGPLAAAVAIGAGGLGSRRGGVGSRRGGVGSRRARLPI